MVVPKWTVPSDDRCSEACERCAEMGRCRHSIVATGAFGGAPYGDKKPVRGVPKSPRGGMGPLPMMRPSVEFLLDHKARGARMGRGGMRPLPLGPWVELTTGSFQQAAL